MIWTAGQDILRGESVWWYLVFPGLALSLTVAMAGTVPSGQGLRRDRARPGDALYVSGTVGDASAWLRCGRGELRPRQLGTQVARQHVRGRVVIQRGSGQVQARDGGQVQAHL